MGHGGSELHYGRGKRVTPAEPRGDVQCDRPGCGGWYEAGTYAEHVRASSHESHDRDRPVHVDVAGNVSAAYGPSCEGSVGPPERPPISMRKAHLFKKARQEAKAKAKR